MTVLPMARRRRNFSGRASAGVKNQVWSSALLDESVLATLGQLEVNLVQASDWTSTGGERGTVLTIRGWLSVSADNDETAKAEGSVFWYIGVVSGPPGGAPPPGLPLSYVDPNILTTGGHLFGSVALNVHRNSMTWDINVKTKRTIRAAQDIRLVLFNASPDTLNISLVTRSLVRKGGN